MINDHKEKNFTVREEDRIAQIVFLENFNVDFQEVFNIEMLGRTKRGHDGFGSTGVEVIKKIKSSQTEEMIVSPVDTIPSEDVNSGVKSEKSDDDLVITSERATMEVNGEIIIDEGVKGEIIIDE